MLVQMKNIQKYFFFFSIICILSSCEENIEANVYYYGPTHATDTSCIVRGVVQVTGDDIIETGIILTSKTSTEQADINYRNSRIVKSSIPLVEFSILVTPLSKDSTYRMRMYAKSNDSIYYSPLLFFKPLEPNSACVAIDGGTYQMGATFEQVAYAKVDEYPVRNITISDFKMGVTEVTNAQYSRFLKSRVVSSSGVTVAQDGIARKLIQRMINGLYYSYDSLAWVPESGYENFPVNVSWYGANEYCAWAGGRLPTESEWEWAARGGVLTQQKLLSGGNASDVDQIAWYKINTRVKPVEFQDVQIVATKLPNELGLYDMSGNVTEWVQDWYVPYLGNNLKDPKGMGDDDAKESGVRKKVVRGGSWADGGNGRIDALRTSVRNSNYPEIFVASCGFRMCK